MPTPYGLWTLNENPAQHGTTITDTGTGGNNGTLNTADGATNKSVTGQMGQAIQLDGIDDYVTIANQTNFNFNEQSFTVMAWVKDIGSPFFGVVASKGGRDAGWRFYIDTAVLGMEVFDAVSDWAVGQFLDESVSFADGNWYHVAAVVAISTTVLANNSAVLYVNGTAPAQHDNKTGSVLPILSDKPVRWGARTNADASLAWFLNAKIDDARIYNVALTQGEIRGVAGLSAPMFR